MKEKIKHSGGYVFIKKKDPKKSYAKNLCMEHRAWAEGVLKRALRKGEVVHHINFNRADNRPENLSIMTRGEHSALHNKIRKLNLNILKIKTLYRKGKTQNEIAKLLKVSRSTVRKRLLETQISLRNPYFFQKQRRNKR